MSKKNGLLTLLTGVALGAAALFFSKQENRKKAVDLAHTAKKKAKSVVSVAKSEGKKVAKKTKKDVKVSAKKVIKAAK